MPDTKIFLVHARCSSLRVACMLSLLLSYLYSNLPDVAKIGLSDYCDSICYRDGLGLLTTTMVDCLTI